MLSKKGLPIITMIHTKQRKSEKRFVLPEEIRDFE